NLSCVYFFFQAEDGIRDKLVTGVQTWLFRSIGRSPESISTGQALCSAVQVETLVIMDSGLALRAPRNDNHAIRWHATRRPSAAEIGRASCRERGGLSGGAG